MTGPRLYGELAEWFHLLTHPDNYVEEAGIFTQVLREHPRGVRTVLELGSGGGNNASHMKAHFEMTLTDLSEDMLVVSRKINPECEHLQGDMRTLRLGRTFDAVFVHDAIAYITTQPDLEVAMRTAFEHVVPGGIALFVPDETVETYRPTASTGGHDDGGRSLRYVSHDEALQPGQTSYRTKIVITMRDGDEERTVTDIHETGVFPRATWLDSLARVGFEAKTIPYDHSSFAPDAGFELFVGLK